MPVTAARKAQRAQAQRAYYRAHRDQYLAHCKARYLANKDKILAEKKACYRDNQAKAKAEKAQAALRVTQMITEQAELRRAFADQSARLEASEAKNRELTLAIEVLTKKLGSRKVETTTLQDRWSLDDEL